MFGRNGGVWVSCCVIAAVGWAGLGRAHAEGAAAPEVVVSVAPVHSVVAAVMDGVGEPGLLIPAGQSPHTFQLRSSTVKAVNEADLIFLIAAGFETALQKTVTAAGKLDRTVYLDGLPGLTWLPARSVDSHGEGENGGAAAGGGERPDWHVWLDPDNGAALARATADILAVRDPDNATTYQANAAAFAASLAVLRAELAQHLAPVRSEKYMVFHDAYQYFEHRFGLLEPAIVTVAPDRLPSARQIAQLRREIEEEGIICLFAEPQFASPLINTLREGLPVRIGTLDPVGAELPLGPALYPALLTNLGEDLSSCLLAE